jgi:cytochrome P450
MTARSPDDRNRPAWNPRDASVLGDQRRAYDDMRDRCPVAFSDFLGWSVFRHRDVSAVVRDPATFSSATRRRAIPNGMDPPDHRLYRSVLEQYFAPERMAGFEPRSRQIAVALLAPLLARGEVEFISEFAQPFPHQAVCAFVGWPVADWNRVQGWTHGNQDAAFREDHEAGAALAREFSAYVTDILDARRAEGAPVGDLMGGLLATTARSEPLTNDNIVSLLRTWIAGHGTLAAAVGLIALHLASDVDLQNSLRQTPALIDRAIREVLRADGPLVANNRTTTRDVELGGTTIRSGERVSLMWIATNRDPEVFPDPDSLDLDREAADNLVFGTGIHRCLGEPLAMLNLRVAVEELLARTSRIELGPTGVGPRDVYPSDGLSSLSIVLTPTRPPHANRSVAQAAPRINP